MLVLLRMEGRARGFVGTYTSRKNSRKRHRHSTRAQTVRQDLDRIGERQWRESDVVEAEEDEEHGDDGASYDFAAVVGVHGAQSGDDGECKEHADRTGEPERTTAVAFCGGCADEGEDCVPDLETEVDESLGDGIRHADAFENRGEVVGDWIVVSVVFQWKEAKVLLWKDKGGPYRCHFQPTES